SPSFASPSAASTRTGSGQHGSSASYDGSSNIRRCAAPGNRVWGGRPRPPTLLADVLTTRDPILIKGQDECSTSICHSESDHVHSVIPNPLPPRCHSESASAVRNLLL